MEISNYKVAPFGASFRVGSKSLASIREDGVVTLLGKVGKHHITITMSSECLEALREGEEVHIKTFQDFVKEGKDGRRKK